MAPPAVQVIWGILLLILLLGLPVIVRALHGVLRAARSIERYFAEMLEAAQGIAGHTVEIRQLDTTIEAAGGLLATAGTIHEHAETIRSTLAARVTPPDDSEGQP